MPPTNLLPPHLNVLGFQHSRFHSIPFTFANGHEFAQIHFGQSHFTCDQDFKSESQVVHAA